MNDSTILCNLALTFALGIAVLGCGKLGFKVSDTSLDEQEGDLYETSSDDVTPLDSLVEYPIDSMPESIVDDADEDPVEECTYPTGPYAFTGVGDTVGPMSWPSALTGIHETMDADLSAINCDPVVKSIFIQIAATTCPECPSRIREIASYENHWSENGAKWIFVVADSPNASYAGDYIEDLGVTFGIMTNDADNTEGAYTIAYSPMYSAFPWTAVIRASDMQVMYDEPDTSYLDIYNIAIELNTP